MKPSPAYCNSSRRDVYLLEKVSVVIKIRVHFWPEISALGVFLNFDNKRMRSPKYLSAPTPPICPQLWVMA